MSRFLATRYRTFRTYEPGEQPKDRSYLKLNTNESPFAPAPAVLRAIDSGAMEALRLYSDPECDTLRGALADAYGLKPEQVLCGNGSDELLALAFMAWGERGAAFPDMTYGLYSVLCGFQGIRAQVVPLRADYQVDDRDYLKLNKLIVLANPNAPTGLALLPRQIAHIAENNPEDVVLVDEAYVDFGGQSCVPLIDRYENIVVVHTYSKSRALAGLRLGYAMGPAPLIADLKKLKNALNPYNVDHLAQLAGLAALKEKEHYQLQVSAIVKARESTMKALTALGFAVIPSLGNFLFCRHDKMGGEMLSMALRRRGILVRWFAGERTAPFVRITIGSREQMDELVDAVKDILGGVRA